MEESFSIKGKAKADATAKKLRHPKKAEAKENLHSHLWILE